MRKILLIGILLTMLTLVNAIYPGETLEINFPEFKNIQNISWSNISMDINYSNGTVYVQIPTDYNLEPFTIDFIINGEKIVKKVSPRGGGGGGSSSSSNSEPTTFIERSMLDRNYSEEIARYYERLSGQEEVNETNEFDSFKKDLEKNYVSLWIGSIIIVVGIFGLLIILWLINKY